MYIHYCTGVISLLYFWIQSSCKYQNTCIDMGAVEGLPYGLVVRIPGFHPGGPGSIPGVGTLFFLNPVKREMAETVLLYNLTQFLLLGCVCTLNRRQPK